MKWCKLARALNEGVKQTNVKRRARHKIRSVYVDLLDTTLIESCLLVKSPHFLSGASSKWVSSVCQSDDGIIALKPSGSCDFIERQDDGEWSGL